MQDNAISLGSVQKKAFQLQDRRPDSQDAVYVNGCNEHLAACAHFCSCVSSASSAFRLP